MESNVAKNLREMFESMQEALATKTVVGEPINVDGVIIIPLVDIVFGMGVGATQSKTDKEMASGGMGAKITPNSLLVIKDGKHQIIHIQNKENWSKVVEMVPGIVAQLGIEKLFNKKGKE